MLREDILKDFEKATSEQIIEAYIKLDKMYNVLRATADKAVKGWEETTKELEEMTELCEELTSMCQQQQKIIEKMQRETEESNMYSPRFGKYMSADEETDRTLMEM